jgi:hypothetical protein
VIQHLPFTGGERPPRRERPAMLDAGTEEDRIIEISLLKEP